MEKFKVGDRVTAVGNIPRYSGSGTIVDIDAGHRTCEYRVEFDCTPGGVWAENSSVKPLPMRKIIIHTDGKITTALLKEGKTVVKKAVARCNPADTYDFNTGANLAYSRLMGVNYAPVDAAEDKPVEVKPEPIKLYCIKGYKPGTWLTRGKVYECDVERDHLIEYDSCEVSIGEWHTRHIDGRRLIDHLVPLISRPAKVGEWVYVHDADNDIANEYENGDVLRIIGESDRDNKRYGEAAGKYLRSGEYLVLDGYNPEICSICNKSPSIGKVEDKRICKSCAKKIAEVLK